MALWIVPAAQAESPRVFRCGNVYTNQPAPSQNCKPLTGGHVTVIEGTQVQTPVSSATPGSTALAASSASSDATASAAPPSKHKVDPQAQRQRDAQASVLLQTELQRAQARHTELLQLWRNGEPERQADEQRQPQKYQERVAQLRAALQRSEADVAGLLRELARLPNTPVATSTP
ncbi:hypothetical protein [Limnohabitans sp. B9-3]|uniref:hypothetical protein n=1 Tax=Limnohabitans sp. B9-3 TaxID=1100707 RepID=UPI000CBE5156|nr:hypothetical protein [Limnohabitans sp. B9-3]PIT76469.1 hypothetical protein B9Z42_07250 [Limnohabitans sp. B9-3]